MQYSKDIQPILKDSQGFKGFLGISKGSFGILWDILGILEDSCGISMGSLGIQEILRDIQGIFGILWDIQEVSGIFEGFLGISRGSYGTLRDIQGIFWGIFERFFDSCHHSIQNDPKKSIKINPYKNISLHPTQTTPPPSTLRPSACHVTLLYSTDCSPFNGCRTGVGPV